MPEEETEQRFIVVVRSYGDPEKLRDNTVVALSKALHYSYMPGCLVITEDNRIHRFLPEPEMGRHHTRVIGFFDLDPGEAWHDPEAGIVTVVVAGDEACPGNKATGMHCYHHEDDPEVPCCYEQPELPVENTWQT